MGEPMHGCRVVVVIRGREARPRHASPNTRLVGEPTAETQHYLICSCVLYAAAEVAVASLQLHNAWPVM